jgi:hypothetical protein
LLMARRMESNFNTLIWYAKNALGSITYFYIMWGINTLIRVFCKHHGLNHFFLKLLEGYYLWPKGCSETALPLHGIS